MILPVTWEPGSVAVGIEPVSTDPGTIAALSIDNARKAYALAASGCRGVISESVPTVTPM